MDKYLSASNGKVAYTGDRKGVSLDGGKVNVEAPKNGDNVYLTMDQRVQSYLEDAMKAASKQYNPESLIGIVADQENWKNISDVY